MQMSVQECMRAVLKNLSFAKRAFLKAQCYFVLFAAQILFFATPINSFGFSAGVGTDYPLGIHADISQNFFNESLFVRARYGLFLSSYTDSMNSIAEDFEFYNSATSDIIAETLNDASYIEAAFGWQESATSGWSAEISYSAAEGEGQVTGSTIAAAVSGISLPSGTNLYDIEGEVELLGVSGGYKWPVGDSSYLLLRFGVLKPMDSKTSIDRETSGPIQEALLQAANRSLDEYLNDILKKDVYIPVVGLTWNYRF